MVRPDAPTGITRPAKAAGVPAERHASPHRPPTTTFAPRTTPGTTTSRGACAPRAPVATLSMSDQGRWPGNGGGGDAPACGGIADLPGLRVRRVGEGVGGVAHPQARQGECKASQFLRLASQFLRRQRHSSCATLHATPLRTLIPPLFNRDSASLEMQYLRSSGMHTTRIGAATVTFLKDGARTVTFLAHLL